ncbi:Polyubiquitin 8 [Acorus gramineus]|uniref:Polyubiquitin 8 n=1 Tax=Acorus gramineus TaxID=55184 RepID=A0AAV9BJP4_ACOGR|nr:Polyubiquitin 8 [Acorus gramineus]
MDAYSSEFVEEEPPEINIFLRVIKTIPLRVKSTDKISDVKARFNESHSFGSECLQKLFYANNYLEDDKALSDHGITENSTLNMYLTTKSPNQIFIKTSEGKTITLEAKTWETIHTIKAKILEKEGIPLEQQVFFYDGRLLEDGHSLNFYGIKEQSTLHMVIHKHGIQISVSIPYGETIRLDVKKWYTVHDVKMLVESKVGTQKGYQRLTYDGQNLDDWMTLAEYKIRDYSVLKVVDMFEIFIACGNIFTLEVEGSDTIGSIRERIRSKLGTLSEHQRIFFAGKSLHYQKTLEDYGIQKGSTLEVLTCAPSNPNYIFVDVCKGQNISLDVKMKSTIGELKAMIQERTKIPRKKQRLSYLLQDLDRDDCTLNDYCINVGATLFVDR